MHMGTVATLLSLDDSSRGARLDRDHSIQYLRFVHAFEAPMATPRRRIPSGLAVAVVADLESKYHPLLAFSRLTLTNHGRRSTDLHER